MKEKTKSLLITIGVILAALLIVGLAVYNSLYSSGAIQRGSTAVKSDHFSVDGMMFSYYYGNQLQNYSSVFSYMGIDTSKSLKTQDCPYLTDGGSWFEYFVDVTRDYAVNMLSLCEIGYENGNTLTAEDKDNIDAQIKTMEDTAASAGYDLASYLRLAMGNPLKAKDVRKCMELTVLAQKAYNQVMDGFTYTDEDYDKYAEENADSLNGVDYSYYTVNATDFRTYDADENPTSTAAEESAAAKEAADRLAAASSASDFDSVLRAILSEIGAEDIDTTVSNAHRTHASVGGLATDVSGWMSTASAGQTMTTGEEGASSFTVYMLTKPAYRDETRTRNVRHILFMHDTYEDSSKADEVYAEWEASGFSEDKFIELCAAYSEDPGSKENGGLYENVTPGAMIAEFDEWLFDGARKPGDHDLIESSSYGWHIMYYVGESDTPAWKVSAESAMKQNDYNALLESRSPAVTYNEKTAMSIGG